jgi:hypothetical protein
MSRGWLFILTSLALAWNARAATLHQLVETRIRPAAEAEEIKSERTWAASGYNPIQSFQYRYGRDYEDNLRYYRVPFSNEGGEAHTLRINFKSFEEIAQNGASRELSRKLLDGERSETINQQQYDAYVDLTQQILSTRMVAVLAGREADLKKTVDQSGQSLGLPDASVKDLVGEMEKLQRVNGDHTATAAGQTGNEQLSADEIERSSMNLIDNVAALAKRIPELNETPLQTEHKRIELKLRRISKEIGWADDRKILDHIDIQRDTLEREDAVRFTFNVPFLRFDNENRARDKALLLADEHQAERESRELDSKLRRKRAEIFSVAAQVESMRARLQKTKRLTQKVKGMSDIELKSVLGDFGFELERDVLLQAIRFYNLYLELLRDTGSFARFADLDLLDPKWQAFGK